MKFVVLRRDDDGRWEHLGPASAVEVPDLTDDEPGRIPEQEAVEKVGFAGVFLPIPFDRWLLFEAEAQVTVRPVMRKPDGPTTPRVEERLLVGDDEVEVDPDLAGLTQGPKG